MSDRTAFHNAICAEPDDDAPRLVFADWLDEQGESARAEFIRIQCALRDLGGEDEAYWPLRARERALWKEHGQAWRAELPAEVRDRCYHFRRGFPNTQADAADFCRAGDRIVAAGPLEILCLRHCASHWEAIHDCPALGRIATLDLDLSGSPFSQAARVLDSPALTVARLSLGQRHDNRVDLGPAGADRLCDCPSLRGVRSLGLYEVGLGRKGIRTVARSPNLSGLRTLEIRHNSVDREAYDPLFVSPHLANLERLDVWYDDNVLERMNHTLTLPHIETLFLGEMGITARGAVAIGACPCAMAVLAGAPLQAIRSLALSRNPIGPVGVMRLRHADWLSALRELDLSGCELGDAGASIVADMPLTAIRRLYLSSNGLTDVGVRAIFRAGWLGTLRELDLADNPIGESAVTALLDCPYLCGLWKLDVSGNLGEEVQRRLAERLHDE